MLTALGKLGLWVYRKDGGYGEDDKKFNAAVSKMVNCLMTKAALKINASLLRRHHCPLSTTTNLISSFYVFLYIS